MARIEPLPPERWPAEMQEAFAAMRPPEPRYDLGDATDRPKGMNILGTFAHYPELARAWFTFNGHVLLSTTLSERQRELLVLRVAARRGARYEWAQHVVMGRDVGLDDEEIARVAFGPDAPHWSELEAALLRAVDELVDGGAITEPTWSTLAGELDERQLLDLVFTVGAYETLAWLMCSLELDLDDDLRTTRP